jgi:hypothetical protein
MLCTPVDVPVDVVVTQIPRLRRRDPPAAPPAHHPPRLHDLLQPLALPPMRSPIPTRRVARRPLPTRHRQPVQAPLQRPVALSPARRAELPSRRHPAALTALVELARLLAHLAPFTRFLTTRGGNQNGRGSGLSLSKTRSRTPEGPRLRWPRSWLAGGSCPRGWRPGLPRSPTRTRRGVGRWGIQRAQVFAQAAQPCVVMNPAGATDRTE